MDEKQESSTMQFIVDKSTGEIVSEIETEATENVNHLKCIVNDGQAAEKHTYSPLDMPDTQTQHRTSAVIVVVLLLACLLVGFSAWALFFYPEHDDIKHTKEEPVSITAAADSVLYLEIFDDDNELIGTASGFLLNDYSSLVTNYHVVQDAYRIVATNNDETASAEIQYLLAYDEIADIAVLECDTDLSRSPLFLADSNNVKQGDIIYAVGYPLGIANTMSDGIVSSRYIDDYENDIIQVTAAISEGNSGGPLLNEDALVVGIMCASYVYGQNMNIAISSNTLRDLLDNSFKKINLKHWENRPAMPGYEDEANESPDPIEDHPEEKEDSSEGGRFVPVEPAPQDPQKSYETEPITPKEETPPKQAPTTDNNIYGTFTERPDTAIPLAESAFNGSWRCLHADSNFKYDYWMTFLDGSFERLHQNYSYDFFGQDGDVCEYIDCGTYYIEGVNLVVTYRRYERKNPENVSEWITEKWPIAYMHPSGIRFDCKVSGYDTYYLVYGDASFRGPPSKDKTSSNIAKEDVRTVLSKWLKNNNSHYANGYPVLLDSANGSDVCLTEDSEDFLLISTVKREGASFITIVGVPKSGDIVSVFLRANGLAIGEFNGSAFANASTFSGNMPLRFVTTDGSFGDVPLLEDYAKYASLSLLSYLDFVLTEKMNSGYDISDFGFTRGQIVD